MVRRPGVLVDANVLLDLSSEDERWYTWSASAVATAASRAALIVNPIVYAEVSVQFTSLEELDRALPRDIYEREPLPWDAAFVAGKAFLEYRRRGGTRRSPLPDFYIGAHAAVRGYTLLTRDATRYRTYFPDLDVIAPDADERTSV